LIDQAVYKKLFKDAEGVVGYVPMQGNVGDKLIEFATLSLMRDFGIAYEVFDQKRLSGGALPRHIKRLYISGGGNLGDLYPNTLELRHLACSKNRPVTVLPQTLTNLNEDFDKYDQIWLREKRSLDLYPGLSLAPDMAMSLQLDSRRSETRQTIGVFLREDREGLFADHPASCGDPATLASNIASFLDLIAPYRHIVTDRLHFAIAGLLMKRKVTLLPNAYHKNLAMWETWFYNYGCNWAESLDQVDGLKKRKATRKIPVVADFELTPSTKITRTPGWQMNGKHLFDTANVTKPATIENAHNTHVGVAIRELWKLLHKPQTKAELLSQIVRRKNINRFNRQRKLNILLRRLFLSGAIELIPDSNTAKQSLCGSVGGRYGVPLEVTLYKPVRLNEDVYIFADFRRNRKVTPIWYRVEKKYQSMLANSANTFLLSALQIAMWTSVPLWVRGGSVDLELMRNLQQFQQIWSTWHQTFQRVSIHANVTKTTQSRVNNQTRAISCFSGGVDSTFSLFNHSMNPANAHKLPLSHALLVHGFDIPVGDQASFDGAKEKCQRTADDLGIKLISMATNIREMKMDWRKTHGAVIAGALHLISRPFSHGLIPATLNYGILYPWGSTPLTDHLLGTSSMLIQDDGSGHTRTDKIRAMKGWLIGIENLRFCPSAYPADHNCGKCGKCTISAIMLLLANTSKKSIRPFPGHRRIAVQLMFTEVSRLDRSDLRDEIENLKALNPSPNWTKLLIRKMDEAQR